MASGSFNVSTSNQYIKGKIEWSSVQDIDKNQSTVTATLRLSRTNTGYTTEGRGSFTITINGNSKTNDNGGSQFVFTYNSNTLCVTHTVAVPHNADGSKSITITASGSISRFTMSSQGGTAVLDTIPRASSISSFPSFTIGNSFTVSINRASSSFTHTLELKYGSTVIATRSGVGSSVNFSLSSAEQDTLYNAMKNVTSGTVTLTCQTYNGSTAIGNAVSKNSTAYISSSIVPTFTSLTAVETVSAVSALGVFIQNLSRIKFTINGASGAKHSTITAYKITFNGVNYNVSSATTGAINKSGTLTAKATITDSRGRTANKSISVTLVAYSPPQISSLSIVRCNADGTLNPLGTSVRVITKGSVSSISSKNIMQYRIKTSARGANSWVTKKDVSVPITALNDTTIISTYDIASSFDLRVELADKFNTTISLSTIPTGEVTMSWGKTGVGIGKIWEQGALDVGGDGFIDGNKIWHKGNDGAGSGLDADLLDGMHLNYIINSKGDYIVNDTRSIDTATNLGEKGVRFEFKSNSTDGLSDGGSFHGVMTFQPCDNSSGGKTYQLAFTYNNNLWLRSAVVTAGWSSWRKVSLDGHSHSYLPLSGGTVSGQITLSNGVSAGHAVKCLTTSVYSAIAYGWVTSTSGAWVTVNYPRPFRRSPNIIVSNEIGVACKLKNITTTSAEMCNTDSGSGIIYWIACGYV